MAGFAAVLTLNAINPDAVIARTNVERARHGEELDAYYLTTLSADGRAPDVRFDEPVGRQAAEVPGAPVGLVPGPTVQQRLL